MFSIGGEFEEKEGGLNIDYSSINIIYELSYTLRLTFPFNKDINYDFIFKYNQDERVLDLYFGKDHNIKIVTFLLFCSKEQDRIEIEKEIQTQLNIKK